MNWNLLSLLKQLVKENHLTMPNDYLDGYFKLAANAEQKQSAYYSLIDQIIRLSSDSSIGMKAGSLVSPNSFYGLGYLFMTADNLVSACQRICEFPQFFQNIISLSTEVDGSHFKVIVSNDSDNKETSAIINEATLGVIYQYMNWLSKDNLVDCDVCLKNLALSPKSIYEKYFHRQPQFGSARSQLSFPLAMAEAPFLTREPEYHLALYSKLKEKHERMSHSFLSRVQVAVRNSLKLGGVSRSNIAKQLSLSEKTLERRLEKNNFSFRKLTESVRLELAHKYLVSTKFSIDEIARNLGYCDRSSFSKAFKKWTGSTPSQQRQILQQQKM